MDGLTSKVALYLMYMSRGGGRSRVDSKAITIHFFCDMTVARTTVTEICHITTRCTLEISQLMSGFETPEPHSHPR